MAWRGSCLSKGGSRPQRHHIQRGGETAFETRSWGRACSRANNDQALDRTYDGSLADSGWKVKETGAGVWGCDAGYMSGWQEELRRRVANCFPSTPSSTFARSSEEPVSAGLAFWAGAG